MAHKSDAKHGAMPRDNKPIASKHSSTRGGNCIGCAVETIRRSLTVRHNQQLSSSKLEFEITSGVTWICSFAVCVANFSATSSYK